MYEINKSLFFIRNKLLGCGDKIDVLQLKVIDKCSVNANE